jgi:hypothetical protein
MQAARASTSGIRVFEELIMFSRRTVRRVLPLMGGLLPLAVLSSTLLAQESEPNSTIATASGNATSSAVILATMTSQSDVDFFRITVPQTSRLTIKVTGLTPGVCEPAFDPVVALFNSGGTEIANNDDIIGAQGLCSQIDPEHHPAVESLQAGTYYIRVTSLMTPGTNHPYRLEVLMSPAPEPLREEFTYQGRLESNGVAFTGYKQVRFSLWSHPDSTDVGSRLSLPMEYQALELVNGYFTANLDFTMAGQPENFDGNERYLQIEVADVGGANNVILSPRQRLAPAPHAVRAMIATASEVAQTAATATLAESANFAYSADTATTASSAASVSWSGVTNKPIGFADGTDDAGGWINPGNNPTLTYTGNSVGINTGLTQGFNLAVNGSAAKAGGGSWSTYCDQRLKHDIEPMQGTLDKLLRLRGYTFEYNPDAIEHNLALPGKQAGLIAQEVQQVFPDWVEQDKSGYLFVTERATTALMVEALRDLRTEKDEQIKALEAKIERLEKLLQK